MSYVDVFDHCASIAQVARGCPTPTLRRAYVDAMRAWCAQTQWLRVNATGSTVADQAVYDLGSDTHLEIIGLFAVSGSLDAQQWLLHPGDPSYWNPAMGTGQPMRYAYVPEGQMALSPTPDDIYGITYTAIAQPKEGVVEVPSEPLKKYSAGFEAGALAYLLSLKDTPWYDPAQAGLKERKFGAYIANGKAEVQRRYSTGSQRAVPRTFGVA